MGNLIVVNANIARRTKDNAFTAVNSFGNSSNYAQFDEEGNLTFYGTAEIDTTQLDTRYLQITDAATTYVPYTGATGDVDLGEHGLTIDGFEGIYFDGASGSNIYSNDEGGGEALFFYSPGSIYSFYGPVGNVFWDITALTADKTFTFPDATGTFALTSDLSPYLLLAGGTMTGNLIFNDNISALFGTGSDLEIFHNGTDSYIQNNTGGIVIENDTSDGDITFKVNDGGVDTTVMTLDGATGNVGIGTTSPTVKLEVGGNGAATTPYALLNGLRISGGDTSNTIWNGGRNIVISSDWGQKIGLYQTNTTTGLTVDTSSGNVGIGTTGPDRKFHTEVTSALTNTVQQIARLTHITSGTPAANIGLGLEFEQETAADNNEIVATIETILTDVTATSEDADLSFKLMAAGATAAEKLRLSSTGALTVYGDLNHDGSNIGFFATAPIAKITTAVAEAAFTENAGGTVVNVDSTFGGYTLQQIAQALVNYGLLT